MMMNYMDPLAGMYQDYDRYVRTAEAEGKKPVSLWKFALGTSKVAHRTISSTML